MTAPSRPPLAKGLVVSGKALAALAGAGAIVGGLSCGVGLATADPTSTFGVGETALFGFFVLILSLMAAYVALTLYALGLAVDPAGAVASRVLLAAGGVLAISSVALFLWDAVRTASTSRFFDVFPYLAGAGLLLMGAGLLARLVQRR